MRSDFLSSAPEETLEGEKVRLVRARLSRAEEAFALIESQRERLGQYLSWPSKTRSLEDQKAFLILAETQWNNRLAYHFHLIDPQTSVLLGSISAHSLDPANGSYEAGFWIDRAVEGRGLTLDACRLLRQAMTGLGFPKIQIRVHPDNLRSQKIAAALNLTLVEVRQVGTQRFLVFC
jgi:ribosomal-protein-serine acetyltransferase